jgi:monoamine oxidase
LLFQEPFMLDVAIIGGGLCGLALAHSLRARGVDWRLFEARERLGGRVLTARADDGTPVDLGATWFWPATQPAMARLVADLGLASFDQVDDGRVLLLNDPSRVPQVVAMTEQGVPAGDPALAASPGAVHGGARRVEGGMGAVVEALARPLPASRLRLGHALHTLVDRGDFVELQMRFGEAAYAFNARRVVLALPPRVVEADVQFVPALAPAVCAALRAAPTWMATAAKAAFAYRQAFWRADGLTGNAWVDHAQAMLAEVFDASGPGDIAALAGFCALDIAQRAAFERGRELLLDSQMGMLFGAQAVDASMVRGRFWQDWAKERETCSATDAAGEAGAGRHPAYGDPLLAQAFWGDRLHFAGSETARQGGGYLEGALSAAGRVRAQLKSADAARRPRRAANDETDRTPA